MARNDEKQLGKLNRLWLKKEREEGRIKDICEGRPKLSTLNSASSVKKWIPSIKNEIEYYLQQSQLSHYPDRKIAEFQNQIEALEKEYKNFIRKLRVLDPSCRDHPWTPRAYCKRRADTQHDLSTVKTPRLDELDDKTHQCYRNETGQVTTTHGIHSFLESEFSCFALTNPTSETSDVYFSSQDQPLMFDRTRQAVASAGVRASAVQRTLSQTQKLAQMLRAGLPNLNNSSSRQACTFQSTDTGSEDGALKCSATGQKVSTQDSKSNRLSEEPSKSETEEKKNHSLGLDCYLSSDEDDGS